MALSFVAQTSSSSGTGTSATCGFPAGAVGGDYIFAAFQSANNFTHVWPASWTKLGQVNSGTGFTMSWGWTIYNGVDGNVAVQVNSASAALLSRVTVAYRGGDIVVPDTQVSNSGSTTSESVTSYDTTRANSIDVCFISGQGNTISVGPSGYTNRLNSGVHIYDKAYGASGSATGTL